MSLFNTVQRNALNDLSPRLRSAGVLLGDILEGMDADLTSGNLGISAAAGDVDSLALGGGAFSQDLDATIGLTFGYGAGRFFDGAVNTSVAAGTLALTGSATNYVEVNRAGVVSKNTTGFTAGSLPLYTIVAGVSSITSVASAKPLLSLLSALSATKSIALALGDVAATKTVSLIAPAGATTITRLALAAKTTVAADDTNFWTFTAVNKGAAGTGTTALLAAGDANTTKATGGSGLTAYVGRALALHGTPANLAIGAGHVIELTLAKAASAASLDQLTIVVDFGF